MDANYEMEYEKYTENIADTLNSLGTEVKAVNTPVVPASEKLKAAGNIVYIDEYGKLKCQPDDRYKKTLKRHFGEFAKTTETQEVKADIFATSFVQGA